MSDNELESLSKEELLIRLKQTNSEKKMAEQEGKSVLNWLESLKGAINIGNKITIKNLVSERGLDSLPESVRKPIAKVKQDFADLPTDDESDEEKPFTTVIKKKAKSSARLWTFFAISLLILIGYFLTKSGFFSKMLGALKEYICPTVKGILLELEAWAKAHFEQAWKYIFELQS